MTSKSMLTSLRLPELTYQSAREAVRTIRGSKLVLQVGNLMLLTTAAQLLAIASAPALSRLFSPAEFGAFGLFVAFTSALNVVSALNYDTAIPSPAKDNDAANLSIGAAGIGVLTSVLLAAVYATLIVTDGLGYGQLPMVSTLLVASFLLATSLSSTLHHWMLRRHRFDVMGQSAIALNAIRAITQLSLGWMGFSWSALAIGEVAGRLAAIARLSLGSFSDIRRHAVSIDVSSIRAMLYAHRRFPLVLLPAMCIDQILSTISIPVITSLFGLAAAGQYFLMRRVIDIPLSFLSKTIAEVFYAKIAAAAHENPAAIRRLMVRVFAAIVAPASVAALPLLIWGPSIFAWTFGESWRQAGYFAALTVPALVLNLGTSPVSRVFAITRLSSLRYVYTAINGIGMIVVFTLSQASILNVETTVAALAAVSFVAYASYFLTAYIAAGSVFSGGSDA